MKPENVLTGTVVGRFLFGLGDGPDVDNEPDFVAARGRVTFIPGESTHPDPSAFPVPVTMLLDPVVGVFDSEGYLCTPNAEGAAGTRGVKLVANNNPALLVQDWTWNVTYKFEASTGVTHTIKPHGLNVDANEETDLVTAIKLPTSPGIPLEQVEAAVFRAEAEARAARETVDEIAALAAATIDKTLVEATVVGDELVLTRENGTEVIAGNVRGEPGPAGPNTVPTDEAMAGNVETDGTATRAAVLTVVDGREVGNAQLAAEAVTGEKIAPDSVGLDRLTQGMRDQFGQYEQDIEDRPTSTVVEQDITKSRECAATIRFGTSAPMGVTYEIVTVHGALSVPGVVGKHLGQDYEQQGTSGPDFKPLLETPLELYQRTGADIVLNASGYVTDTSDPRYLEIDGAQIKDGVIYHDFNPPGSGRATDGIGFRADGSAKVYSSRWGDSAASMVADGVVNSFSFGPAYMVDGVKQEVTGTAISARQILGTTQSGDLMIVTTSGKSGISGISYPQAATLAEYLGFYNAVAFDGGGSAQTLAAGQWVHPSTDAQARDVPDLMTIKARLIGDIGTSWLPLEPVNGFTAHTQVPAVRVKNGTVHAKGALVNPTATVAVEGTKMPWWAAPDGYQRFPATIGSASQYYDVDNAGSVFLYVSAANPSARYLSVIAYPAKPI